MILQEQLLLKSENIRLTEEVARLTAKVAELQPEVERVLTKAEEAVLAKAKPETEAEAIAALDAAKERGVLGKIANVFRKDSDEK